MGARFDLSALALAGARLENTAKAIDRTISRVRGTLVRRLPVAARRDIQLEYQLSARRLNAGLRARIANPTTVELIGLKRGIGRIRADRNGRYGAA